ncbi:MAG: hypothetical protein KGY38_01015 [Desulfobacterales bacterium]|nr:hypothetical protein [Desulfobacterales bacterium]
MTEKSSTVFIFMPHKSAVMLKAFLVTIVIMFGFIGGSAAAEGRDALARADRLYEEGTMESLKLSVKLYAQAAEKAPDSYQAFWKGARSSRKITRMAVIREINNLEQICVTFGKQGMKMALEAIKLNPEGVEGHFYYAVNVGGYAKGASIWAILSEGLKGKAQKHLKKAYQIDKGYNQFVLVMHMGLYYEILPWFAGQDKDKAIEFYREALRLMPEDALYRPQLHVLAGKLMLAEGIDKIWAMRLLYETAESGVEYFSDKAREILAEHGAALPKTGGKNEVFKGSMSYPR